jgi:threonine synthase
MFPSYRGEMEYVCQRCGARYSGRELYYTCPECSGVFLLQDLGFSRLLDTPGQDWREIFDRRVMSKHPALRGIFRFYELISPILEPEDIVWLGEGNTPIVNASSRLEAVAGQPLAYKNDGQNPSASFKDRGMACALSAIKAMARMHSWDQVLTVCASTGDTSAAAAMYAAYVGPPVTSVVLLPQGRVTPQQLGQPLGSGAVVLELPGVFDDCMRVVEYLADHYRIALLNSKNSWRILGCLR